MLVDTNTLITKAEYAKMQGKSQAWSYTKAGKRSMPIQKISNHEFAVVENKGKKNMVEVGGLISVREYAYKAGISTAYVYELEKSGQLDVEETIIIAGVKFIRP